QYFESPFIQATEVYYKAESEKFVSENSVTDYMKKAEARLKEEEDRLQVYLNPATAKPLLRTCEAVLVKNHMEIMWEEFQNLLDNDKQDDLFRMYSLLSRVAEGLDPLRTRFETHVRRAGLATIERIADHGGDAAAMGNLRFLRLPVNQEPKTYVDALLEVHKKYNELVVSAFRGEAGFVASLDKRPNCHSQMTVFKYVEDKDVFQKFYSKMLAKRLVHGTSASEDAEANMITKLKEACGYEYTSKLQRMFTDIGLSKDLNEAFNSQMNTTHDEADLSVDFSIMVLGTSAWPLQPPATKFTIPEDLVQSYNRFQKFYQSKYSGRKLNWLFQLSKAELKANYLCNKSGGPRASYTFQVSTYQVGILLQYNNSPSCTRLELLQATELTPEVLDGTLGVLVKLKVLIEEDK
ncbi:MAG: Cullin, partial [Olpidium bornovanus]